MPMCIVLNWLKMRSNKRDCWMRACSSPGGVCAKLALLLSVVSCLPARSDTHNLSVYVWVSARSADMISSLRACRYEGVREANPLVLGTSDGRFTTRTLAVQAAITAVSVVAQRYAVRKWPRCRRLFTVLNFSGAGLHTYATIHNTRNVYIWSSQHRSP